MAADQTTNVEAPGHTDLMVTPEEIDRFVEANPPHGPVPPTTRRAPFTARKSAREGHVSVAVKLSARGWSGDALRMEGSADLSSAQARDLAQALSAAADAADAKVSAKTAAKARRQAWREREIAAGRMVVVGRL